MCPSEFAAEEMKDKLPGTGDQQTGSCPLPALQCLSASPACWAFLLAISEYITPETPRVPRPGRDSLPPLLVLGLISDVHMGTRCCLITGTFLRLRA